MGNFSGDTFDKLKHYVGVRLQQGVPLVDADWNEMEDIRKHELRDFLKNFVGNGVPDGNDGFRIAAVSPVPADNNFTIKRGDGTQEGPGRCLVDGWDVMNESDINYTDQENVLALETPTEADRTDIVYLDVWEREVDSSEDGTLFNPAIGIDTCVRLKLEWVVRVEENVPDETTFPTIDIPEGHAFYPLAILKRKQGEDTIPEDSIIDLRLTGVSMGSQNDIKQIATDVYGPDYSLDHDSLPNLKVSLNESINAVLRGDSPSTPVQRLTTDSATDQTPSALIDSQGDIWVFWDSERGGNIDIYYKRYRNGTWDEEDTRLTSDLAMDSRPSAVIDSQGDIWVFWQSVYLGVYDIVYKHYSYMSGTWGEDTRVPKEHPTLPVDNPSAVIDGQGDIWVFWQSYISGPSDIYYKRYSYIDSTWRDDTRLTTDPAVDQSPSAVIDSQGDIWVFWDSERSGNSDIYYKRYTDSTWGDDTRLTTDPGIDVEPSAVIDSQGDIWVFWERNQDIYYKRYTDSTWGDDTRLTNDSEQDSNPSVILDSQGDIWVFWDSIRNGNQDIWYKIITPNYSLINQQKALDITELDRQQIATDVYGPDYSLDHDGQPNLNVSLNESIKAVLRGDSPSTPVQRLTTGPAPDRSPFPIIDSQGDIWVFWDSIEALISDIYYKRTMNGTWGDDTRLTTDPADDRSPSAVIDYQGNLRVYWQSYRSGEFFPEIFRKIYSNGEWSQATWPAGPPGVEQRSPFVVLERPSTYWAFWQESWPNENIHWSKEWLSDSALTTSPAEDVDPSAVIDSQGDIWVFWASNRSENFDIYYKRYMNGEWEDDTRLTTDTHADRYPSAVIDSQGDIWVFWASDRSGNFDIYYKRYTDGEWGDDTRFTTDPAEDVDPSAVIDSQGHIWVFWASDRSGNYDIWYKIFTPNYSHINQQQAIDISKQAIDISKNDSKQIAADVYGPDYSLDHDSQPNLKVSLKEAINAVLRGVYPSTPILSLTTQTGVETNPSAVLDSQGDIWVFWWAYGVGESDIFYKRYMNETWGDDTQLTTNPANDYEPSAVTDSQGDIWVFWASNREGMYHIYYKRYIHMTSTWEVDTHLLTGTGPNDRAPNTLMDTQGDIWVFWNSDRGGYNDIYYKRYSSINETWGQDTPLTSGQEADVNPWAVVDGQGAIWVFWQSSRGGNDDIYFNRFMDGAWGNDTPLTTDAAADGHPSAVMDSDGDIWVFWYSFRGGTDEIYYKRYSVMKRKWEDETRLNSDSSGDVNPVAVMDSDGDIWVFWQKTGGHIYYRRIRILL